MHNATKLETVLRGVGLVPDRAIPRCLSVCAASAKVQRPVYPNWNRPTMMRRARKN